MRYLFLRDKGQANSVVWPVLYYDGDSDEAKALLATPNGRATAWLLIDHGHQMEWRLKSRQLRVHIFAYAGDYCMLWDLEPQSPPKQLKRGHSIKRPIKHQSGLSIERHVKRGGKEDFDAAKKRGDTAYDEMQAALAGCANDVQDFDPKAFENGWTRKTDGKSPPDKVWQDVIKTVAGEGKAPTVATSFYVNVIHDKDFTNSLGQPTKVCTTPDPTIVPCSHLHSSSKPMLASPRTTNITSPPAPPSSSAKHEAPHTQSSDA